MTLTPGWVIKIFLNLHAYLKNICRSIDEFLKSLNAVASTTSDGYMIQGIFFWIA